MRFISTTARFASSGIRAFNVAMAKKTTKQTKRTTTKQPKKAVRKPARKPKPKLFYETGARLRHADREQLRSKGLHVYDRRDNGRDLTIEPYVIVDFLGTIVTDFPVRMPKKGPSAHVVYNGNAYLRDVGAKRVDRIDDLKPRKPARRKAK